MAVMDEFKEERESIKTAPWNKKVEYFWDYYKIHTIATIAVLGFLVTFVYSIWNNEEVVFQAELVNVIADEDKIIEMQDMLLEQFQTEEGAKEAVILDTSLYLNYETPDYDHSNNIQKLVVLVAAREVENFASDANTIVQLAYNGYMMDLRECLSEEQMDKYEENFIYIDQVLVEEIEVLMDDPSSVYELPELKYGSYDEMEEPIPVGIYVGDETTLGESVEFFNGEGVVGICASTDRLDRAVEFLEMGLE